MAIYTYVYEPLHQQEPNLLGSSTKLYSMLFGWAFAPARRPPTRYITPAQQRINAAGLATPLTNDHVVVVDGPSYATAAGLWRIFVKGWITQADQEKFHSELNWNSSGWFITAFVSLRKTKSPLLLFVEWEMSISHNDRQF